MDDKIRHIKKLYNEHTALDEIDNWLANSDADLNTANIDIQPTNKGWCMFNIDLRDISKELSKVFNLFQICGSINKNIEFDFYTATLVSLADDPFFLNGWDTVGIEDLIGQDRTNKIVNKCLKNKVLNNVIANEKQAYINHLKKERGL